MNRRSFPSVAFVVVCALAVWARPGATQSPPRPTDGVAVPDRSVTTTSDATSLEVNPAGLGFIESTEFRYGFDLQFPASVAPLRDEHAAYAATGNDWLGAGVSLQWLDRSASRVISPPYQKLTLGSAVRPVDSLSAGFALDFFGSLQQRAVNRLVSFDLGAQWRPSRFLGVGVTVKDTNRPFFRADRGIPVRINPGAALRLLGGGLIVGSDLEWTPARGSLRSSPRVSFEPLKGVRVYGRAAVPVNQSASTRDEAGSRFTAGLDVALGQVGLEAASSIRTGTDGDDGLASHSQQVWYSPTPRRSLLPPIGRWVEVDLSGEITERVTNRFLGGSSQGFLDLLTNIRAIAEDPRVDGVVFRIGSNSLGYGQAWELREQIDYLRSNDTTTAAFLEQPGFVESYIASAADRTFLLPNELYEPAGVRITTNTYGEALASVGVEAEFVRIGEYKSAPETFVRETPSEPALEQTNELADDLHGEVVQSIADSRQLERDDVQSAIDSIPLYPGEALQHGFVDDILYPDELRPHLRQNYGAVEVLGAGYDPTPGPDRGWNGGKPIIGVVYIDGSIIRGKSAETPFIGEILTGSETVVDTLERLGKNPQVRAVVVRVDSPGGSAVASDMIYRAIRRVAQVKPVVASMGDVAASGGYYVASGADTIFATPNTLTGSVGIFAGKFNVEKLASWVGVSHTVVERGQRSGRFDPYESWSSEQRKSVKESIEYLYQLFLQQASETRPFGPDALDELARGRVWSGEAARDEKLVDRVGGLVDAIHRAEKEAGMLPDSGRYQTYPQPSSFLEVASGSGGPLRDLWRALESSDREGSSRNSAVKTFLRRLGGSIRLPLLYEQGEALMLPPRSVELRAD